MQVVGQPAVGVDGGIGAVEARRRRASRSAVHSRSRSPRVCASGGISATAARRLGEADDAGHVERAAAQAPLLTAALEHGASGSRAHVERADALGPVHLVRRERRQVDAERRRVEGRLPIVCMASVWNARRARGRARRSRRCPAPCRSRCWPCISETRIVSGRSAPRGRRDDGPRRRPQPGDAKPCVERPARLEHRLVLVAAVMMWPRRLLAGHALKREVVGLGRARGEDDIVRLGVQRARPSWRARAPRRPRVLAERVARAGGVAEPSVRYGSIASRTRGSTGVVAWRSR